MTGKPLQNARHEAFARYLFEGKTAGEAYELAGYRPNRGNAATLKTNQSILARVAEFQQNAADRAEITQEMVLRELAKIGFANMEDYVRVNLAGEAHVHLSDLTRDQWAAVQEIVYDKSTVDPKGDDPVVDITKVKFKLGDKKGALVDIGKHLGMFIERRENKNVDEFSGVTSDELRQRAIALLQRRPDLLAHLGDFELPGGGEEGSRQPH